MPRSNRAPTPQFRVECFMLCEAIQVANLRMNILGGGWGTVISEHEPFQPFAYPVSVATRVAVPQSLLGHPLAIRFDFLFEDGEPVLPPLEAPLTVEVPPGQRPPAGALIMPLEIPQFPISRPGRYEFVLSIEGRKMARMGFYVVQQAVQTNAL